MPAGIALEHFAVLLVIHRGRDVRAHGGFDLLRRGPDIAQENRLAGLVVAERLRGHIEIHASGKRVGDHQRRRGQIICAHQRMNAPLEIAISAEHRNGDKAVVLDGRADVFFERAAVADASGAAVTDKLETKFVEIFSEARGCRGNR